INKFEWDFDNFAGSNIQSPYSNFSSDQTYFIKLKTIDHLGCADSVTKSINTNLNNLANENVFVNPFPVPIICSGDSAPLNVQLQFATTNIASQLWSTQDTTNAIYAKRTGEYWAFVEDNKN